jgi:hypothetical protein
MPLRRLPTVLLALAPFLALGLIAAVLAHHAKPIDGRDRAGVEIAAPT